MTHLPVVMKTRPWNHQLTAYDFAYEKPAAMLAMGMGTGKSKVSIDLIQNRGHGLIAIIAPKKAIEEEIWERQFAAHCALPYDILALGGGSSATKTDKLSRFLSRQDARGRSRPGVVLINYDAVWRPEIGELMMKTPWDLVICDESHRIKAPRGRASNFAVKLGQRAPHRLCLSGTPMAHTPLDVWKQYLFLDPSIFGPSFVRFRARYAVMGGFQGQQVIGYQNEDELHRKFYSLAYKVGDEVLDLPPYQDFFRTFTIGAEARKIYRELDRLFYAEVAGVDVTPANAGVKLMRLHQLASGFLKRDDGTIAHVDTAKEHLLADILGDMDTGDSPVVFYYFHEDAAAIARAARVAGFGYLEISGQANDVKRWKGLAGTVLGVQIDAGSEAIDLTWSRYAIYYSVNEKLYAYQQSRKRVHRPGQTRPTIFIHLVGEHTRDVAIYRALEHNRNIISYVLDDLRHGVAT